MSHYKGGGLLIYTVQALVQLLMDFLGQLYITRLPEHSFGIRPIDDHKSHQLLKNKSNFIKLLPIPFFLWNSSDEWSQNNRNKMTAYHHRFGKLAIQHDILERMPEEFSWRGGVVILVILPSLEEVKRRLLTLRFVPFIAFIWKNNIKL